MIKVTDITPANGLPHIHEYDLANALQMDISELRDMALDWAEETKDFGHVLPSIAPRGYLFTEHQAMRLCRIYRYRPAAAEATRQLSEVFAAWHQGKTVHVREHHRRRPTRARPIDPLEAHLGELKERFDAEFQALADAYKACAVSAMSPHRDYSPRRSSVST